MADINVCKNKEHQLRRTLKKYGYSLYKSKKPISIDNLGGYMVVDFYANCVVCGSRYELSLDDVSDWLKD